MRTTIIMIRFSTRTISIGRRLLSDVDEDTARNRLVDRIDPELESTERAMRAVPRHEFVPPAYRDAAYADRPLPIGEGQTISAPSMVAEMCDQLAATPGDRILEIGTGCGYHAAVMAEIVGPENVFSVEFTAALAEGTRDRLDELGYEEISIRIGNGRNGWPEHAPYDAVYLTCAADDFPELLIEQTNDGGLLLGPIGRTTQRLVLAKKLDDGRLDRLDCGGVRFVPMRGPDVR